MKDEEGTIFDRVHFEAMEGRVETENRYREWKHSRQSELQRLAIIADNSLDGRKNKPRKKERRVVG